MFKTGVLKLSRGGRLTAMKTKSTVTGKTIVVFTSSSDEDDADQLMKKHEIWKRNPLQRTIDIVMNRGVLKGVRSRVTVKAPLHVEHPSGTR